MTDYAPRAPLHEDPAGALASFRQVLVTIRDSAYEEGECLWCGAEHPEPHHETCPAQVAAAALNEHDAAAFAGIVSHQPWCAKRVDNALHNAIVSTRAHPGEPHRFGTSCIDCGAAGMVNVSIVGPDERVDITPYVPLGNEK